MSITSWVVGIWGPSSSQRFKVPMVKPMQVPNLDEAESCTGFLKAEIINYLKTYRDYDDSLKIELPLVNSGGKGGSIFSAAKLWDRIYFGIERKNDRSADTVSIRWISLKAENFQNLLENSLRKMLTEDVPLLKDRAHLRNDFWKTMNSANN